MSCCRDGNDCYQGELLERKEGKVIWWTTDQMILKYWNLSYKKKKIRSSFCKTMVDIGIIGTSIVGMGGGLGFILRNPFVAHKREVKHNLPGNEKPKRTHKMGNKASSSVVSICTVTV